jgi:hypothetical protein
MATRTIGEQDGKARPALTSEQVWRAVARASFAVLSHLTPAGEPRSSGVVYKAIGRTLVAAVAPGNWKAQHIAADGRVAVTVVVRPGGILALAAPIPRRPSAFTGRRSCTWPGPPQARPLLDELGSLIPAERRASACVIEITPVGAFRTYGIGVSLRAMVNPAAAQARVPVTADDDTR